MLTFIIPLLLGSIIGFLIRGKPSDTFAITTGKRVAWAIGFGFGGLLIGMPIGLAMSSTTGPQIAGLVGTGLGLGVFNILSIENPTYKKWSDKNAFSWLIGGVIAVGVVWNIFIFILERWIVNSAGPVLAFGIVVLVFGKVIKRHIVDARRRAAIYGLIGGSVGFWSYAIFDKNEFQQAEYWILIVLGLCFILMWGLVAYSCILLRTWYRE
jgi:hypothetical protein